MATSMERRLSTRVHLRCPLQYRVIPLGAAGVRNAIIQDVSQSGFRFRSDEFISRHAGFIVEMHAPEHAPVRSLARAVWVKERPGNDGFEVGGMFVEPPHAARATLSDLVSGP